MQLSPPTEPRGAGTFNQPVARRGEHTPGPLLGLRAATQAIRQLHRARLARHRPRATAAYGRMSYNDGISKTERIELRVSPEDKDAITAAAAMEHTTTTEFVRHAVLERAQHVQARSDRTLMPAEQFDALVAALDTADDAPNLARAFARPRRFVAR